MVEIKVVTVATHSERYFPLLVESCKRFNLELVVLGWNSVWGGFTYKFDLMRSFLETQSDETVILFVDAYDVVILQPAQLIMQRFIDSGAKLLVAKDWNLMFYHELTARVGFGMCQGTRLNSGTYMGRVKDLKQLFATMCADNKGCKEHKMDDQVMMTQYCNRYPENVQIDTEMALFIAVSSEKNSLLDPKAAKLSVRDGQLWHDERINPCIIHVPFNTRIESLLEQVGFDCSEIRDADFKGEKVSRLMIAIAVAVVLFVTIVLLIKVG